jgi:choline dehydrogenase
MLKKKFSKAHAAGNNKSIYYDYIFIGAGSAGCTLVRLLTEDPDTETLLIEAGGADRRWEVHIPSAFYKLFKSSYDWAYYTEPQTHLYYRKLFWPRGKMLGGSSSLNAMIYIRGSRRDFDEWHALGNRGWSFECVLVYFKKAENQERGASEYHGVGGPLNVTDLRYLNPVSEALIEAGLELGFPPNDDFNGQVQDGFGRFQVTQKGGQRHSAADASLRSISHRPNLRVLTHAQVTRILFDKGRAVGVSFIHNGQEKQVRVNKEVILCGGAINSPQILMLSGIGPARHLKELGIQVIADLPGVGQHLQDHLCVPVAYSCTQPITLDGAETMSNILRYLFLKRGPLTSNIAEAGGFVRTKSDLPAPDLQFHFVPAYGINHGLSRPKGYYFTIIPVLLRPQSRGHITLRSRDPLAPPAIQPHYLDNNADLQTLIKGVRLACELGETKALSAYRGAAVCKGLSTRSDEGVADYIRGTAETLYHPTGTCRMGNDSMAVVDDQLRVYGVDGLRVVDASVMPVIVRGNTNAPTIMIAEKAASLIRQSA